MGDPRATGVLPVPLPTPNTALHSPVTPMPNPHAPHARRLQHHGHWCAHPCTIIPPVLHVPGCSAGTRQPGPARHQQARNCRAVMACCVRRLPFATGRPWLTHLVASRVLGLLLLSLHLAVVVVLMLLHLAAGGAHRAARALRLHASVAGHVLLVLVCAQAANCVRKRPAAWHKHRAASATRHASLDPTSLDSTSPDPTPHVPIDPAVWAAESGRARPERSCSLACGKLLYTAGAESRGSACRQTHWAPRTPPSRSHPRTPWPSSWERASWAPCAWWAWQPRRGRHGAGRRHSHRGLKQGV